VKHREITAIRDVADLLVGGARLLEGDLRRNRDEGTDGVVERLGPREVMLGEFDGGDLAGADRGCLLEGGEVME